MSKRTQQEARALRLNENIGDEYHHNPKIAARAIDQQSRVISLQAVRTAIKKLEALPKRMPGETARLAALRTRRDELVALIKEDNE